MDTKHNILRIINNIKKTILSHKKLSIVATLIAAFLVYRVINSQNSPLKIQEVKTSRGDIVQTVSTSGKTKAGQYSLLTFQTGGKVNWVGVKEGDKVTKWQALAGLDTIPLNAVYQQALNNYRNYQAAAENVLDQVKDHSSDETFAQKATRTAAEVARDNAYDSIKAAEDNLRNAVILAPFDGIITDINSISAGVNVSPTISSIGIANPDTVYFNAEVSESDLPHVALGQKVNIKLDTYPDENFTGEVSNIGLIAFTSSTGGNAYNVRVTLPQNTSMKFKVGMQGDIDIIYNTVPDVLKISSSVLVFDGGKNYVWIISEGKTRKVEVTIGASSDSETEIKSGLTEGEEVVDNPPSNLKEGQRLAISH